MEGGDSKVKDFKYDCENIKKGFRFTSILTALLGICSIVLAMRQRHR